MNVCVLRTRAPRQKGQGSLKGSSTYPCSRLFQLVRELSPLLGPPGLNQDLKSGYVLRVFKYMTPITGGRAAASTPYRLGRAIKTRAESQRSARQAAISAAETFPRLLKGHPVRSSANGRALGFSWLGVGKAFDHRHQLTSSPRHGIIPDQSTQHSGRERGLHHITNPIMPWARAHPGGRRVQGIEQVPEPRGLGLSPSSATF